MKFTRDDREFVPTTKPWWTSHAFEMHDGKVGVARIHATSTNNGVLSHYMLDLTQWDVDAKRGE